MIVWLASYPRSGNTLTVMTIQDVFGIRRIGTIAKADLSLGRLRNELVPSPTPPWDVPAELINLRGDELVAALEQRPEPFFIKTHRLSEASTPNPAIYIIRDGRDALVSHAHFVADRDIPQFRGVPYNKRLGRLIRPGIRAYGHWSENTRTWLDRSATTAVIRFEELVLDPAAVVANACTQLGMDLGRARGEMLDFQYLRERMPSLFRRGKVGSWREEMSPGLQERFWRVHGQQMRALGYASGLDSGD